MAYAPLDTQGLVGSTFVQVIHVFCVNDGRLRLFRFYDAHQSEFLPEFNLDVVKGGVGPARATCEDLLRSFHHVRCGSRGQHHSNIDGIGFEHRSEEIVDFSLQFQSFQLSGDARVRSGSMFLRLGSCICDHPSPQDPHPCRASPHASLPFSSVSSTL